MLLECVSEQEKLNTARKIKQLAIQFMNEQAYMNKSKCREFYISLFQAGSIYEGSLTTQDCPDLILPEDLREIVVEPTLLSYLMPKYISPIGVDNLIFTCAEEAYYFLLEGEQINMQTTDWYYLGNILAADKGYNVGTDFAEQYLEQHSRIIPTEQKLNIMYSVQLAKFTQNFELKERLKSFKNQKLVFFNNYHDNFWGECCCPDCRSKEKHNYLGNILNVIANQL